MNLYTNKLSEDPIQTLNCIHCAKTFHDCYLEFLVHVSPAGPNIYTKQKACSAKCMREYVNRFIEKKITPEKGIKLPIGMNPIIHDSHLIKDRAR